MTKNIIIFLCQFIYKSFLFNKLLFEQNFLEEYNNNKKNECVKNCRKCAQ